MSDSDRTIARDLIAQSVGRDGKVDFNSLKSLQFRWAIEQTEATLTNSKNMGDAARDIRATFVHDIDRATKEVLGIIPESQWHYSDYTIPDAGRRLLEAFKADHVTEYSCNLPKNFDREKSLGSQGVQCHKR